MTILLFSTEKSSQAVVPVVTFRSLRANPIAWTTLQRSTPSSVTTAIPPADVSAIEKDATHLGAWQHRRRSTARHRPPTPRTPGPVERSEPRRRGDSQERHRQSVRLERGNLVVIVIIVVVDETGEVGGESEQVGGGNENVGGGAVEEVISSSETVGGADETVQKSRRGRLVL